jgi:hypothetical protein
MAGSPPPPNKIATGRAFGESFKTVKDLPAASFIIAWNPFIPTFRKAGENCFIALHHPVTSISSRLLSKLEKVLASQLRSYPPAQIRVYIRTLSLPLLVTAI